MPGLISNQIIRNTKHTDIPPSPVHCPQHRMSQENSTKSSILPTTTLPRDSYTFSTFSPLVNQELASLFSCLLSHHVQPWYSAISPSNTEFTQELLMVLEHASREVERRLSLVDWTGLICRDLPIVVKRHLADYRRALAVAGTPYASCGAVDLADLFMALQPHIALRQTKSMTDGQNSTPLSQAEEEHYMRQILDFAMELLVPQTELKSDCVRHLLREILITGGFQTLVQNLTDPDYLNELLLGVITGNFGGSSQIDPNAIDSGMNSSRTLNRGEHYSSKDLPSQPPLPSSHSSSLFPGNTTNASDSFIPDTLFKMKSQSTFLKRRKKTVNAVTDAAKVFVSNINNLTQGSIDKVSAGFDRVKTFIPKPKSRKSTKKSHASTSHFSGTPPPSIVFEDSSARNPIHPPLSSSPELSPEIPKGYISDSALVNMGATSIFDRTRRHSRVKSAVESTFAIFSPSIKGVDSVPSSLSPGSAYSSSPSATDLSTSPNFARTLPSAEATEDESGSRGLPSPYPEYDAILSEVEEQRGVDEDDEYNRFSPDVVEEGLPDSLPRSTSISNRISLTHLPSLSQQPSSFMSTFHHGILAIWDIYQESKRDPFMADSIDLRKYGQSNLLASLFSMLDDMFSLTATLSWLQTVIFFLWPFVFTFFGYSINRLIIYCIYWLIKPEQVAKVIYLFRVVNWPPDGVPVEAPIRNAAEKQVILRELREKIESSDVVKHLSLLIGEKEAKTQCLQILDVIQHRRINKHLLFILIDLVLMHLVPEVIVPLDGVNRGPAQPS